MKQLALALTQPKKRARGKRPGPKARKERRGFVPHLTRPVHDFRHPVHVTIRRVRLGPSFRAQRVYNVVLRELERAKNAGVRVIEYSAQDDHLHLMIEGADAPDLSAQMRKLFSRIAMMVNQLVKRRGSLFSDRHHRRALKTPREVRNALVYVLFNARKHGSVDPAEAQAIHDAPDPFSSAPWFTKWAEEARPPPELNSTPSPLSAPKTWLANVGWLRAGGPIRFDETPRRGS